MGRIPSVNTAAIGAGPYLVTEIGILLQFGEFAGFFGQLDKVFPFGILSSQTVLSITLSSLCGRLLSPSADLCSRRFTPFSFPISIK